MIDELDPTTNKPAEDEDDSFDGDDDVREDICPDCGEDLDDCTCDADDEDEDEDDSPDEEGE